MSNRVTEKRGPSRRHVLVAGTAALAMPYIRPSWAAEGPIKMGMVIPFTGATGAYGPEMEKAAKLAVKSINDAGGLLGGRKLELYIEDSETIPTAGAAATKKLIEVNDVNSVIGYWGSPIAMASKQLLIDAKKVMMVSCAANAVTEEDHGGLIWRFQAKSTQWGPVGAKILEQRGYKKVSVLAQQNPFIVSMIDPFVEQVEKAGGTIVDNVTYLPEQPSYRAEVEKVFGANPDAVFVPGLLTDFTSIMKEVYRGGFDSKVCSLSLAADSNGRFLEAVGPEVAEGIDHFQPAPPIESPSYKAFVKAMGAPEGTVFLFAGNAFDQVWTAALAMEKAGTDEAAVWTEAIPAVANPPGALEQDGLKCLEMIRNGEDVAYVGAGADCDFNDNGDQLNRHFLHQVIRDGKNEYVQTLS
ncbi:ABC transporter substrate-binding protein [Marivibrio halodurans]|uniref:ABC transporter substrate-binding protein n=1 Tax=Marivibrio halodurans TaxID=2039722 RepID=A0A8J7V401_9PROT|nr:ABC transporter substrate-binding protein [Marivibrio halodurans]MBP5858567.1 ABC transporter substrate-binding protein [Marivibrio halodurans]